MIARPCGDLANLFGMLLGNIGERASFATTQHLGVGLLRFRNDGFKGVAVKADLAEEGKHRSIFGDKHGSQFAGRGGVAEPAENFAFPLLASF